MSKKGASTSSVIRLASVVFPHQPVPTITIFMVGTDCRTREQYSTRKITSVLRGIQLKLKGDLRNLDYCVMIAAFLCSL